MEKEFVYNDNVNIVKLESNNEEYDKAASFDVVIGDSQHKINVSRISDGSMSIDFGNKCRTAHAAETDSEVYIHINGKTVRLSKVTNDLKKFSRDALEYGAKDEISTPMPGKVVKILVGEGDTVTAGQPLVIVESMKMENEIKSPTDGTVTAVNFKSGDLVEPAQPIIKLEPAE
jgi:biotin carboxyl carrier protein